MQDSAALYHDWNERVAQEYYAPNARARLLDGEGRIQRIVTNYSRMSFNFGPTLLSWLKAKTPEIHEAIVEADKQSREHYSGHGSALGQCYNHMIMPLANARDKRTQVHWGIRDFAARFGRKPEGMWLPETAADNASLEALAELGIKFTILSPIQARRVWKLETNAGWQDVNGARVDRTQPYLVKLASGRDIPVFFYGAPIAQGIAFEHIMNDGGRLGNRLMGAFIEGSDHDQLVNAATDGESYGHHFKYGDMALAFALSSIENDATCKLTIYGEFLESHPPTHKVEIHQGSAWSCSHGVGRWKENCGCNSGRAGWSQEWRGPLRQALDWLRDQLAPVYENEGRKYFKDPWQARDEYITVILDRSPEIIGHFFAQQAAHNQDESEQLMALRLLEIQRHAMLMYTSCGWLFDEISGLESVQVIQYAARAIQLSSLIPGMDLEPGFLKILEHARSNTSENENGRVVYEKFIKPAVMTREKVAAHYAISSLFEAYPEAARIYSFIARQMDRQLFTAGSASLALGSVKIIFVVTRMSDVFQYVVANLGDHNLTCGIRSGLSQDEFRKMDQALQEAFERADFPELIRLTDRHFGEAHYCIKNLFRDEQHKVLNQILTTTREKIHNTYRLLTDRYATLTRFLNDLHVQPLKALVPATEFLLNSELRRQFENGHTDAERVKSMIAEVQTNKAMLDKESLAYAVKKHLDNLSKEFENSTEDFEVLRRISASATVKQSLPLSVNLWKPQNIYDQLFKSKYPEMQKRDDEKSRAWVQVFLALGRQLGFHVQAV